MNQFIGYDVSEEYDVNEETVQKSLSQNRINTFVDAVADKLAKIS